MGVGDRRGVGPRGVDGPVDGDVGARPPADVARGRLVRVERHRQDVARHQLVLAPARRGDGEGERAEADGQVAVGAVDEATRPEAAPRRDDRDGRRFERGVGMRPSMALRIARPWRKHRTTAGQAERGLDRRRSRVEARTSGRREPDREPGALAHRPRSPAP